MIISPHLRHTLDMHIGLCIESIVHHDITCALTCRNISVNKELSIRTIIINMDTDYLDTKFGLMESMMRNTLQKNREHIFQDGHVY